MSAVVLSFPLLGGALLEFNRADTTAKMAADLTADGVDLNDKRACMACLLRHGYLSFIAARFVDDARALAFQEIAAGIMGDDVGASA